MTIGLIKKCLFWSRIRKQLIIRKHLKVAKFCRALIEDYDRTQQPIYDFKPLKTGVDGKHIIWQYWGGDIPPIVKMCFNSVDKYYGTDENCLVIRLSDKDLPDYICFPESINAKLERLPKAFFSDLLRLCLLTTYGGCWLDATVFLTGKLPARYWEYGFFMYQRDPAEPNKKYWENTFAFYFGWDKNFKVKVLSSILFCKKGNAFMTDLRNVLMFFLQRENDIPDYFFLQILFNELLEYKYRSQNCPLESDCLPHFLMQLINDDNFPIASFEETLRKTTIHKLSHKSEGMVERLANLLQKQEK